MEATAPQYGLSNLQLELLKLYSRNIPEEDLLEIKRMLAKYFMKKAIEGADKVWDEKGLDAETVLKSDHRSHL